MAQIPSLSLPQLVCSYGTSTQGCMFKQACISMRYLPLLTSSQTGLLQATMQRQEVLEAQATEFLQWLANSQSCHRAWQLEDWDKDWDQEEADAPKDPPAAQSGQLAGLPLHAGTPWPPGGGNPLASFMERCVWQQPLPMKCCWQGVPGPRVFMCVPHYVWKLLIAGRHKQLCMLLAVYATTSCGPQHGWWSTACAALKVALMLGWCHHAGIPFEARVSSAPVGWPVAWPHARALPQVPPTLLARHACTPPPQQLLPACWDLTWPTGHQGLRLHISRQELPSQPFWQC